MSRYIVGGLILVAVAALVVGYAGLTPFGDNREPVGAGDDAGVDNEAVELGQSIYQQQCSNCHATDDSSIVGPSFDGLYGSDVTMEEGSTVTVDVDHLHESITEPGAKVREGFPAVMPSFDNLSEEEIDALIAFIRSLG